MFAYSAPNMLRVDMPSRNHGFDHSRKDQSEQIDSQMYWDINSISLDAPKNFKEMKDLLLQMNRVYTSFSMLHQNTISNLTPSPASQEAFDNARNALVEKFGAVNALWTKYKKNRSWTQAQQEIWCSKQEAKIKATFKKNMKSVGKFEYGIDHHEEAIRWYERVLYPLTVLMEMSQIGSNIAFMSYVWGR